MMQNDARYITVMLRDWIYVHRTIYMNICIYESLNLLIFFINFHKFIAIWKTATDCVPSERFLLPR